MKRLTPIVGAFAVMLVVAGCATQPSRSQSQETTISGQSTQSVNNSLASAIALPPIPAEGYGTNAYAQICGIVKLQAKALSDKSGGAIGDTHTQNMMLETGGNETNSQEASPKTDVPVNVAWGAGAIGGAGSGGTLDTMYTAFKKWYSEGGTADKKAAAKTDTATEAAACALDGTCSDPVTK